MAATIAVTPDDDLAEVVAEADAGAVISLAAGDYAVRLVVRRSLTLRGEAGATLEGISGRPVVRVEADGVEVVLDGLVVRDGSAELGGGLFIAGDAAVTVRGCRFEGCSAQKGGAVYLGGGASLSCEETTFAGNEAKQGGAMHVDGVARVTLRGCEVSGNSSPRGAGVSVHDGATVVIEDTRFAEQGGDGVDVRVRGTTSRAPEVTLRGAGAKAARVDALPESAVTVG
ncbi:MAG: right-handed parallel beta-helix repeat-containing protein [Deltaproteobacteria bacterium]|nr:right-handed parallel beta-helix repeat-containing protein [Deltaproteobacteria bacterium]